MPLRVGRDHLQLVTAGGGQEGQVGREEVVLLVVGEEEHVTKGSRSKQPPVALAQVANDVQDEVARAQLSVLPLLPRLAHHLEVVVLPTLDLDPVLLLHAESHGVLDEVDDAHGAVVHVQAAAPVQRHRDDRLLGPVAALHGHVLGEEEGAVVGLVGKRRAVHVVISEGDHLLQHPWQEGLQRQLGRQRQVRELRVSRHLDVGLARHLPKICNYDK